MNRRFDENIDNAYEAFHQNHDALRDELRNALPQLETNAKRVYRYGLMRGLMRGQTMNGRSARLAAAATIIVAILLGIHYLGVSPDGTTVAWADVLANMGAAQAVTFTLESECQYKGNEYWCQGTVKIKEPYRRVDATDGHRYGDGPAHEETTISIMDVSRQNRFVLVNAAKKLVHYAPDHGGNDALMSYDGLKKDFRDGTEESLGTVEIDGRQAACFRIATDEKEITIWADPETALPLRIERIAKEGVDKTILSDITFDVELSDDLFDMGPPPDYCMMNMATEEFTCPFELTQRHLVDGLAVSAKSLGGQFPTRFRGGRPGREAFEKSIAESKRALPTEAGHNPFLGTEFVKALPESSDYQYVGEDVRLGDATRAVCWYKPQGSATYRVVYGDLSVKDVEPNDLPPIPWLAEQR
jgi:hypothetical protein